MNKLQYEGFLNASAAIQIQVLDRISAGELSGLEMMKDWILAAKGEEKVREVLEQKPIEGLDQDTEEEVCESFHSYYASHIAFSNTALFQQIIRYLSAHNVHSYTPSKIRESVRVCNTHHFSFTHLPP